MNKLQEMIAQLEENAGRSDFEDQLLQALKEREQELEDATEEQIEEEITQVLMAQLLGAIAADEQENDPDMEDSIQVVRKVFQEKGLHFQEYQHQKGVRAFMLNVVGQGKKLHVKVYLEAFPKVCRIDAVYPFVVEEKLLYPLCEKMLQENFPRRFGALQLDTRDNELSYRELNP